MKYVVPTLTFAAGYLAAQLGGLTAAADPPPAPPPAARAPANPAIDANGYLKTSREAAAHRETRRVTEDEFIRMSREPGTIVLDARSKEMYDRLHVAGAVNLSFPDIDVVSLAKVLPDKTTRILIYCNNNFTPAPDQPAAVIRQASTTPTATAARKAFRPKGMALSLNVPTYISLYGYGYRNVYELAPLIDVDKSKLVFESSPMK
jgi:hypothetical protein